MLYDWNFVNIFILLDISIFHNVLDAAVLVIFIDQTLLTII